MDRITKIIAIIYTLLLALISFAIAMIYIFPKYFLDLFQNSLYSGNTSKIPIIIVAILVFLISLAIFVMEIMGSRMRKARVKTTGIGKIDIGVDAIQSMALNAAKAAQAGVKTCKASVVPAQSGKIGIILSVMTYSDVELPSMMQKVQERVAKDIERYTGIEVDSVEVKVSKVEQISAGVEN